MPLMPKRVKFRKQQRGSMKGNANSNNRLSFGEFGLQALERSWITAVQIEACRVCINPQLKPKGRLWLRIYPDKPISKKPLETRMGKGKGATEAWVAVIRPGTMMFEMDGVPEALAQECMRLAAFKLPIATRFVQRHAKI
jgi:large subunit ribosomal protein L16